MSLSTPELNLPTKWIKSIENFSVPLDLVLKKTNPNLLALQKADKRAKTNENRRKEEFHLGESHQMGSNITKHTGHTHSLTTITLSLT